MSVCNGSWRRSLALCYYYFFVLTVTQTTSLISKAYVVTVTSCSHFLPDNNISRKVNPLTPTVAIWVAIKHLVTDQVKPYCNFWHQGTLTLSPMSQSGNLLACVGVRRGRRWRPEIGSWKLDEWWRWLAGAQPPTPWCPHRQLKSSPDS